MADEGSTAGGKVFTEDTVAVLLMALGNVSITSAQYALMSSLDGTKTASSFQHAFRSTLKKAKDLKARVDGGETFDPVTPSKKRAGGGGDGATASPTPKKARSTPSKPKATPKGRGKKIEVADGAGLIPEEQVSEFVGFKMEEMEEGDCI